LIDKLVTITLDKERRLRLTLKGMLEFQKLTNMNLLKGFNLSKFSLEETAALVFACLLHEDKELTYDDVLCMIDISNLRIVIDALSTCLEQSTPTTEASNRPLVRKSQRG